MRGRPVETAAAGDARPQRRRPVPPIRSISCQVVPCHVAVAAAAAVLPYDHFQTARADFIIIMYVSASMWDSCTRGVFAVVVDTMQPSAHTQHVPRSLHCLALSTRTHTPSIASVPATSSVQTLPEVATPLRDTSTLHCCSISALFISAQLSTEAVSAFTRKF